MLSIAPAGRRFLLSPAAAAIAVLFITSSALGQAGDPFAPGPAGTPGSTPNPASAPPGTVPRDARPDDARAPQGADQTIDLRPKYRAGEQLRYVMQLDSRNRVQPVTPSKDRAEDEELTTDQQQNQRVGLLIRVVEAGPEGAKLQLVYESIRLSLDLPGGRAEFDSTRPRTPASPASQPATRPAPPSPGAPAQPPIDEDMSKLLEQLISPMVGTTLDLTTDASGNITKVSGGDALSGAGAFADLLKSLTQGGAAGGPAGTGGAGGIPGLSGMPGMPGMPGASAPGGNWLTGSSGASVPRRVGESWTNTDALGSTPAGPMNMVTTHTLRSASGNSATVTFQGRATGTGSSSGSRTQTEGSQYTGQYVWDTRAGQLKTMQSEMNTSTTGQIGTRPVRMSSQTSVQVRRQ